MTALEGVEAGTVIKTLLKTPAWLKSTNSGDYVVVFVANQIEARMTGLEEIIAGLVPDTAGGCFGHRFGGTGTLM